MASAAPLVDFAPGVDPTATGETEITRAFRETLKRKREAVEEQQRPAGSAEPAPADAWVPPTAQPRACVHEVAMPLGFAGDRDELLRPSYSGEPAKTYPFVLDTFQSTAIACLERKESVLVAAHTSAGKTVVAEYAIAMAFRDKQKVIYTSPLKARRAGERAVRRLTRIAGAEQPEVPRAGGGVFRRGPDDRRHRHLASLHLRGHGAPPRWPPARSHARCPAQTTEILRSMAYRGSELLSSVGWVIFDEVHYMQDRERGVVWEECIMATPPGARCVFLSATLPNALEFAQWVTHLHATPCHVVYTDRRPTPLEHYLWPIGAADGATLVVDQNRAFLQSGFDEVIEKLEAARRLKAKGGADGGRGRGRGRGRGDGDAGAKGADMALEVKKVVQMCVKADLLPAVVFSFSRRDCEVRRSRIWRSLPRFDGAAEVRQERVRHCGADDGGGARGD